MIDSANSDWQNGIEKKLNKIYDKLNEIEEKCIKDREIIDKILIRLETKLETKRKELVIRTMYISLQ